MNELKSDQDFLAYYGYDGYELFPYLYVDGVNLCCNCFPAQFFEGVLTYAEATADRSTRLCELCWERQRELEAELRHEAELEDDLDPYYGPY